MDALAINALKDSPKNTRQSFLIEIIFLLSRREAKIVAHKNTSKYLATGDDEMSGIITVAKRQVHSKFLVLFRTNGFFLLLGDAI